MNTLALGYVIPAIRAYSGLPPVRQYSYRAYNKKPGHDTARCLSGLHYQIYSKEKYAQYPFFLELCRFRGSRERYHVTYVLHARNEEDKTLETESETAVGA